MHVAIKVVLEDYPLCGVFRSPDLLDRLNGPESPTQEICIEMSLKGFVVDSEAHDSQKQFCRFARSVGIFYEFFSSKSCAFFYRHSAPALFDTCIYITLFVGSYCLYLQIENSFDTFFPIIHLEKQTKLKQTHFLLFHLQLPELLIRSCCFDCI